MRDAGTEHDAQPAPCAAERVSRTGALDETRPVDPAEILVAIPTLDEADHIERTLRELLAGQGMDRVTVVVADGGSRDATQAIVARVAETHRNVRLIDNPDRRQASAINRVVETCAQPRHTILVRVDAHSHYPANYVMDVAVALCDRDGVALATVMDSVGETCFGRGAAWAMATRMGTGGSSHRGGTRSGWVDHGHHAGFRLDAFRKVGGYDTGFVANEDAELDHRLAQAGGRIWLEAGIRLRYVMRPTVTRLFRQYWLYGRGRAQTVRKHRVRPRLRQMVPPLTVLSNALSLAAAPVTAWGLAVPGLYVSAVAGTTALVLAQRRCVCALWAAPAVVVMHHAWGAGFLWQLATGRAPRRGRTG